MKKPQKATSVRADRLARPGSPVRHKARKAPAHGAGRIKPARPNSKAASTRSAAKTAKNAPQSLQQSLSTYALPAECMVADASSLMGSLAKLVEEPQNVTLDISALQRIDTAGAQVIASFVRERRTHGRTVEWRGTSASLSAAAQLLGLTSLLDQTNS